MNFPTDIRKTTIEDIAELAPGKELRIPIEIVLAGTAGRSIRVDIRNDIGTYVGTLVPEGAELLSPAVISSSEFDAFRKRLVGLNEVTRPFTLDSLGLTATYDVESEIIGRVKHIINAFLVQGAGVGELLFAASARRGMMEEKVLVTITSNR